MNMEPFEKESIILEAQLSIHPKSNSRFHVCVSKTQLLLIPLQNLKERSDHRLEREFSLSDARKSVSKINMDDIIGCECAKGKSSSDHVAYLSIYTYPHEKKFGSKKTARKRHVVNLMFGMEKTFSENYATALQWKVVLSNLIRRIDVDQSEALLSSLKPPPKLNCLVLVNPFSGPGKALHIFQQRIIPLLAEAGIHYHMKITEYAGHAKEIAKTLKVDEWSGVFIVSGDGLVFEVINGLMERPDWETAIKMPLGALPGGSGNALCCSLLYQAKEPYLDNCVLHATFTAIKHTVAPMDLVAVDLCSGRRLYSFLSVGWGMIADVDIESEKYRSLGNARFTLGAVIRIVDLRKYRGRLSFLPADGTSQLKQHCSSRGQRCHGASTVEKPQGDHNVTGLAKPSLSLDEKGNAVTSKTEKELQQREAAKSEKSNGEEPDESTDSISSVPVDLDGQKTAARDSSMDSKSEAPKTLLLVPLGDPVPSTWTTIEDDFVLLVALYQTHIAQDMVAAPNSKLDDGLIHLIFMRGNVSRIKLIQLLNAMQAAEPPTDDPHIDIIKVYAFRLEPLSDTGTLTVDGEVVEYGPIQAQVLPSMARVMMLHKDE